MVSGLIEYSIRNRFVVILATAMVAVWGVYCVLRTPVDAIPDLSENQIIVFTDWMGRSPHEIDDQITYPLSVSLQGLAGVKAVRSTSEFNYSMINVIFDEHVDFYFARTRVLERLSLTAGTLPEGVVPYLAPDATALGQIFWYTVEGDGYSVDELRAIQDWYVRYQLYVAGVAEVASVGGFVREYQVDVDPDRLRAFDLTIGAVYDAVARSNIAVGGKVFFEANAEYLIRGVGWIRGIADLENVVVTTRDDVPILVRNVAAVQLGPSYRRSMLEKNGTEAVGGVVMMRYGENPLSVTQAIKGRIEQLQAGLPKGVRIIPFYDRTALIHGAIETLTGTLIEELIIASLAVLLILTHLGSALIICATLPLAVVISFLLMYYLGVPSNIMSLSGIAISIGILVDAAVVMVENATHELTRQFGDTRIRGDTTEAAVRACRLVGKPIFFAVMIMLISFLPAFALSGQEGKMFRPLAFTKSFAMVGVAVLAVTFVPAIIPLLLRGRLRNEQQNWIVRSMIEIYRPVLNWLLDVPAAGAWFMGFLFILGAGLIGGRVFFLGVVALALLFGSAFFRRWLSRGLAFALLLLTAAWSWHFPKTGHDYMPPLDEGSIMDMPVTVPRVSITQAADDIRVRDRIMAGFPEVEQVVGKVGRAETATDPSGLDMVETIVTLRPKAWWPRRAVPYSDLRAEGARLLARLQSDGLIDPKLDAAQSAALLEPACMSAAERVDRALRELARRRQREFEPQLARDLVHGTLDDLLSMLRSGGRLLREPRAAETAELLPDLVRDHGLPLVQSPRREELAHLLDALVDRLVELGVANRSADLLMLPFDPLTALRDALAGWLGVERESAVSRAMDRFLQTRDARWRERTRTLDWELEDVAVGAVVWELLDALRHEAEAAGRATSRISDEQLQAVRSDAQDEFHRRTLLWRKTKAELVREMDSELQMPGWGNIWTQPIINRVDMLATGVRSMIGVKVFGPHQEDLTQEVEREGLRRPVVREKGIQTIANEIAEVLRKVPGAVDVVPDQVVGRSYLEIDVDRRRAARYGVNVADIQEAIEVAMGGRTVATAIDGRRRFPIRVRYARDFWQTEDALRRTLVAGRRQASERTAAPMSDALGTRMGDGEPESAMAGSAIQIPIDEVADIRVVEGPSVIKSENGMLRAYVQLNVRERDVIGFVDEARRAVEAQIKLPPGFYIEWSGQFEHQVRARRTLQIIFPITVLLIFVILYMTFNDVRDALLVILAVPGALVGGVIFLRLFDFNFSVAVWVGFIACFGMATQTGIVMLVYLHEAIRSRGGLAGIGSLTELRQAILEGAVHRLRPKLMTEGVAIVGLMPMLWATGVGAEVMKPMAAPVLGGLLVADEVIDLLLPVVFYWYQSRSWKRVRGAEGQVRIAASE